MAISQWILGIRPTYAGLQIAPIIPGDWPGFDANRTFRGIPYRISVQRVGPGNALSLVVDGRPVEGSVVPLPPEGQAEVLVEVTVGLAAE